MQGLKKFGLGTADTQKFGLSKFLKYCPIQG